MSATCYQVAVQIRKMVNLKVLNIGSTLLSLKDVELLVR